MNLTTLRETWNGIETRSQLTLVASLLGVVAMAVVLYMFASRPSYSTLASNLDPAETAKAENALGAAGIAYRTESGGTQIAVVSGKRGGGPRRARREGRAERQPRRLRALRQDEPRRDGLPADGQLPARARGRDRPTIEQIQGVSSATVQLVLPDATLFADEQSKATRGRARRRRLEPRRGDCARHRAPHRPRASRTSTRSTSRSPTRPARCCGRRAPAARADGAGQAPGRRALRRAARRARSTRCSPRRSGPARRSRASTPT